MSSWVVSEIAGFELGDARLNRRLGMILSSMGERPGKSLPTAFQDRTNTKAAYRFFANEKVSEGKILSRHFASSVFARPSYGWTNTDFARHNRVFVQTLST